MRRRAPRGWLENEARIIRSAARGRSVKRPVGAAYDPGKGVVPSRFEKLSSSLSVQTAPGERGGVSSNTVPESVGPPPPIVAPYMMPSGPTTKGVTGPQASPLNPCEGVEHRFGPRCDRSHGGLRRPESEHVAAMSVGGWTIEQSIMER